MEFIELQSGFNCSECTVDFVSFPHWSGGISESDVPHLEPNRLCLIITHASAYRAQWAYLWDAVLTVAGLAPFLTVSSRLGGNVSTSRIFRSFGVNSTEIGLPRWLSGKESTCQFRNRRRRRLDPWIGKIPWRRKWQPTPLFLLR